MKKGLLATTFATTLAIGVMGGAQDADAHATSIGYENGGGAGIVNIWLGTYNHGASSHHLEGSMNLVGVNGNTYASTTVAFTLGAGVGPAPTFDGLGASPALTKPSGLIDGVTNFFTPNCSAGGSDPLTGTDPNCWGGVDHWQGAVFTGLTAGDYKFTWTPIQNPTQEWSVMNPNMDGIFTISGVVINPNPVSEPATLALLGLALAGIGAVRRKKQ